MTSVSTAQPAPAASAGKQSAIPWGALIPVLVGVAIALIPTPAGLKPEAWYFFALFVAVIVGVIMEPIPAAAVGLVGVTLGCILRLVAPQTAASLTWALAGFSNSTVWLIFMAFTFALGYEKTGLGKRIALILVKALGGRTLGLGYAVTYADMILGPFTPSATARSGGIIFPIIRGIPGLYGSDPAQGTERKIGSYIMWTALAADCLVGSTFLTAGAANLLAVGMVKQTLGIDITWSEWTMGIAPASIILLLTLPLIIYKLFPPGIKASKEVPEWAGQELANMGKITAREIVMAVLMVTALGLWIFGGSVMDSTTVAMTVTSLMVVLGILKWQDILAYKTAFNVFIWFATLVTLADGLSKVGFVSWLAKLAAAQMTHLTPITAMMLMVALYFVIHYFFASTTAHTLAVFPVLMAVGAAIPGLPIKAFVLMMGYCINMMGIITPYGIGPSPIYYATGFISRKAFWILGLIFGAIYLASIMLVTPWVLSVIK